MAGSRVGCYLKKTAMQGGVLQERNTSEGSVRAGPPDFLVTEINKLELNHFVVGFPNLLCCGLHSVDVCSTSHFSEVLSAFIFRAEMNTMVEIQCI